MSSRTSPPFGPLNPTTQEEADMQAFLTATMTVIDVDKLRFASLDSARKSYKAAFDPDVLPNAMNYPVFDILSPLPHVGQ